MRYRHVIWDFDGTLFDTYPAMGEAFRLALLEFGFDEPRAAVIAWMKTSMGQAHRHYQQRFGLDEDFFARYAAHRERTERDMAAPYPGIEALCRKICEAGGDNFLYTHRGATSGEHIKRFGLAGCFKELVTSQNGFERKPSPEAVLHLLQKHRLSPDETIMIGDRNLDILAAKNAGIHTCFFSETGEKDADAEYNIDGFARLSAVLGI